MSSIEDRLRAATQAAAGTVPDGHAAPLRLPRRRFRFAVPPLGGRSLAIVTPLAAATAMAAVIAAIVVAHSSATMDRRPGTGPSAGGPALQLPPREFVALTYVGQFEPGKISRTRAVVASTTTGRIIGIISPPKPYNSFVAVSGSADGHTYVLAAQELTKRSQQPAATRFYELRVSSSRATLSTLLTPVLRAMTFGDMALSPDASRLAVTGTWPVNVFPGPTTGLRIFDLATGKLAHSWPVLPPPPPTKCCVFDPRATAPSWEANGRYVALDVSVEHCQDCVVLADTQAPGSSVQAISKVIVRTHNRHSLVAWTNTLITPDGSRVLRSAMVAARVAAHDPYLVPHVFRYSVTSGKTLWQVRGRRSASWEVTWTNPDGQAFVVSISHMTQPSAGFIEAEVFHNGNRTRVPLPAQTIAVAW